MKGLQRYILTPRSLQNVFGAHRYLHTQQKVYTKKELEFIKDNAFEQGKLTGMAYGVLALFSQDQIKKPEEQVHFNKLLSLSDDEDTLNVVHDIQCLKIETSEMVGMIVQLMQGKKASVVARLLTDKEPWYSLYEEQYFSAEDVPDYLGLSEDIIKKIMSLEDKALPKVTTLLQEYFQEPKTDGDHGKNESVSDLLGFGGEQDSAIGGIVSEDCKDVECEMTGARHHDDQEGV